MAIIKKPKIYVRKKLHLQRKLTRKISRPRPRLTRKRWRSTDSGPGVAFIAEGG
jgi:hypothetical protein